MRLLLLLAASGCAVGGVDAPSGTSASQLGDSADAAIQLVDGGLWYRRVSCPSPSPATCIDEGHFWIDLAIRNDAYEKHVGVVWTDRIRNTPWQIATGLYEASLGDGFERWGVDVTTGTMTGIEPHPQIQLAAFVEMAGQTYWDNNGGADYTLE